MIPVSASPSSLHCNRRTSTTRHERTRFGAALAGHRAVPLILICTCVLVLAGCSDDTPVTPTAPEGAKGILILNEGNFQRANSTLSLYVTAADTVYDDVFRAVNGRDLGDTGNSLTLHDGKLFIVMNGSNRVEVIDAETHVSVRTIDCAAGASPRHIVFDAAGTGYISNLYANTVSVYDAGAGALVKDIPVGSNPEGLVAFGAHVFVANSGLGAGSTVSVIATATHVNVTSLHVGDNPTALAALDDGSVLVLCTGAWNDFMDPADDTPGTLYWINPATLAVTDSLTLGGHPQRLAVDGRGYCYTVGGDGIMRVDLAAKTITPRYIPGAFYGLACDREGARLYVTEPLDYVQRGRVNAYTLDGVRLASHPAGVIPGAMTVLR